ncbi:Multimodular transpeptidase-transglycosylase [Winogradskyella psychrotolerans RS-3]|uniref:Multimodular transpeptidase-transglycosylase n=1 Tax=Winogradskyella psychrotolerans RS-3 TaxID=641526 RepID=S7X8V0_9FLAO|nr:transglycosylase domain-containing protein [Winogradskyella psychrotolerans]EPR72473.1 Multimodular transpeptidase-transglycosylase [Winogradskyella psychrotolerans RS-3]
MKASQSRFTTSIKKILKNKWIKWLVILIAAILLFLFGLYISIYVGLFGKVPTIEDISSIKQEQATQLLDKDEKLIGKYYIYDRQPVTFEDLPKHLIDALVATEDSRFYEHNGIDNISLMRVFVKNLILQDKSAGGGSTITLQLAKNLYGRKNYAFFSMLITKFKESIVAQRIEEVYSKDEILTLYLNTVPFSDNTYGIESASIKFFNKSVQDISIIEAAALVGTLKANTYYNPRVHLERSKDRRNVVLNQMKNYGYLSEDSLEFYSNQDLKLEYRSFNHDLGLAPYFRAEVKKQLESILDTLKNSEGENYDLYKDGLIVHTTLDYKMQELAEAAMKEHMSKLQADFETSYGNNSPWETNSKLLERAISKLDQVKKYKDQGLSEKQIKDSLNIKRPTDVFSWKGDTIKNISTIDSLKHYLKFLNTGMLSVEPTTGAVRAYVGGIDYRYFKYDHISQSQRQVGSTFKPFVYTAAIDNDLNPCTYFSLNKVTYTNYDDWTPTNSGSEEEDIYINYNLENALSNSVNTISVKVLETVGIPKVLEQVEKLGISKKLPNEPSLALGVAEISLKDLTGAYASYLNKSKAVTPYYITKIEDKSGNIIATFEPEIFKEQAYSDYTRQVLLEMMKSTVNNGTASRLRSTYGLKNDIAGKTGTTQNNKDGWFVGLTPNLVTITWVGNDNHSIGFKSTGMGQGSNSALPIFAKFYQKLNKDSDYKSITGAQFEKPSEQVLSDLDCEPTKRDGFIKRLFKKKEKKKKFN